jgi:hypothetical protein
LSETVDKERKSDDRSIRNRKYGSHQEVRSGTLPAN